MEINDLEERFRNVEARQSLLIDALLGLLKEVEPGSHAPSFAVYALVAGLTATELAEVETFFVGASQKLERAELTHDLLSKQYEERLPRRKDALRPIAQGYRKEGKFPRVCEFILGEEK